MKNNFRILSILLVIVLMMSAVIIPTSAAIPPLPYGDVNLDNIIDVTDATDIQRYIAKKGDLYVRFMEAADVDADANISIIDASLIQKYVAQLITEFPAGEEYYIDKYFYGVTADYDSDKAIVGYPVTFTVHGSMSPGPATARLYINEQLVAQTSEKRADNPYLYDLTHTFEKAGTYRVKITLSDKWGNTEAIGGSSFTALYIVKDVPEDTSTPVITAITRDSKTNSKPTFTVYTKFGTEPYQYKYTLYRYNIYDKPILSTDFTDSNILDIRNDYNFSLNGGQNKIVVEVKDANGKIVKDEYEFVIEPIVVG